MKRRNRILNYIIILVIFIALVFLAQFAWAKYVTKIEGQATVQIAQFNFDVTSDFFDSKDDIIFATTRKDDNKKVANEMLAPDTYGQFNIVINSTGTQTYLEYEIDIDLENKPTNLRFYSDSNKTEEILVKDNKILQRGFFDYKSEQSRTYTIYWEWQLEIGDNREEINYNDIQDSNYMNSIMKMDINVKGRQVSTEPTYLGNAKIGEIVKYMVSENKYITGIVINANENLVEIIPVDEDKKVITTNKKIRLGYSIETKDKEKRKKEAIDSYNKAIMILNNEVLKEYPQASRALTVEDLNKLFCYNPADKSLTIERKYDSINHNNHKFIIDDRTIINDTIKATQLIKNGKSIELGEIIEIGEVVEYGDEEIIVESVTMNSIQGENTNAFYTYNDEMQSVSLSNYFNCSCWLASRCLLLSSDACLFRVRSYDFNDKRVYSYYLYHSYSDANSLELPAVPVFSLFACNYATKDLNENWIVSE